MTPCRLHITGASGAGVTTLGRALGAAWSVPVHDTDDYYWLPTDPPFQRKRPAADRLELMRALFLPRRAWILSGSISRWGQPLVPLFEAVVFLTLDPRTRMARLQAREVDRYGAMIAPGGALREGHLSFMDWAAGYDDPTFTSRSLLQHRDWLAHLSCPVLELDSAAPVGNLVTAVAAWTP